MKRNLPPSSATGAPARAVRLLAAVLLIPASGAWAQHHVYDPDAEDSQSSKGINFPAFHGPDAESDVDKRRKADEQKRRYMEMVRDYESRQAMTGAAEGTTEKPVKPEPGIPRAEPVKPDGPIGWISNNNWERWAEIRSGKTIFLRRSTNEPAAPDETVILRWRTPNEQARRAGMSSKSSFPNRPRGPLKERFNRIAAGEGDE